MSGKRAGPQWTVSLIGEEPISCFLSVQLWRAVMLKPVNHA